MEGEGGRTSSRSASDILKYVERGGLGFVTGEGLLVDWMVGHFLRSG